MDGKTLRLALILIAIAIPARANEIRVNRETVRLSDPIEITIVLEDSFAKIERVPIRASNLRVEGSPSVASEFRFVNGRFARRRIFTYLAFAHRVGPATIGPIRLVSEDGKLDTLQPITIDVVADAAGPSRPLSVDPQSYPRGSAGEAIFVAVEIDRPTVYVGEQAIVSWVLYSDPGVVRGFRIRKQPALDAFWVEEIPLTEGSSTEAVLGGRVLSKTYLRRAALFPLRAGELTVGPLDVDVQAVEHVRDPFGTPSFFNQAFYDVRRRSTPSTIVAVPTESAADAVGMFTMTCGQPKANAGGPVAIDVVVDGRGSLRASEAPRFTKAPDAVVEIQDGGVVVGRGPYDLRMRRSWKFLLFPRREGTLAIPPLGFTAFDPSKSATVPLTCGGWSVVAKLPREVRKRVTPSTPSKNPPNRSLKAPIAIVGVIALVGAGAWLVRRRAPGPPAAVALLAHAREPRELRRRLAESILARGLTADALFKESSERGERFRALHSLIDLMEKEPWTIDESQEELRKRVREFFKG